MIAGLVPFVHLHVCMRICQCVCALNIKVGYLDDRFKQVLLRCTDGSLNFTREWSDYKYGFRSPVWRVLSR